jgi:parallel beta-helix repeat protein
MKKRCALLRQKGVYLLCISVALGWLSGISFPTMEACSLTRPSGTILYVGGSGPGNYSSIQQAVDNASFGDTVFVFQGTYYEHVVISTSLSLVGEKRRTTIVDGNYTGDVVSLCADGITITGFTMQHSGATPMVDAVVEVHSDDNIIMENTVCYANEYAVGIYLNGSQRTHIYKNCIFENGNEGVYLEESSENLVEYNEIFHNGHCSVVLSHASDNKVINNEMYENHDAAVSVWPGACNNEVAWNTIYGNPYSGIGLWEGANENYIHHNHLSENPQFGIKLKEALGNTLEYNHISGCEKGMILSFSSGNLIEKNNFVNNTCQATFDNSTKNRWRGNYWDTHPFLFPKLVIGERCLPWNEERIIRWINVDFFPAQQPHLIEGII